MPPAKPRPAVRPAPPRSSPPEVVDPIWLVKALGICVIAALICAYATLCLLFYQGEWQLVLHPTHTIDRTPAQRRPRLHSSPLRCLRDRPAAPHRLVDPRNFRQLDSNPDTPPSPSSISTTAPAPSPTPSPRSRACTPPASMSSPSTIAASAPATPPSIPPPERMTQDTAAALDYLTSTRHIPARNIIPYGVGLGASLAANLSPVAPGAARRHPRQPRPRSSLHSPRRSIHPASSRCGCSSAINSISPSP